MEYNRDSVSPGDRASVQKAGPRNVRGGPVQVMENGRRPVSAGSGNAAERRFVWLLWILIVPGALWGGPGQAQAQEQEGVDTGVAVGQVVEAGTSQGLAGVFVVGLDLEGRIFGRGFSGQEGRFVVQLPVGGPYRVRAESMGVQDAVSDTFRILAGDSLRLPVLELVPD